MTNDSDSFNVTSIGLTTFSHTFSECLHNYKIKLISSLSKYRYLKIMFRYKKGTTEIKSHSRPRLKWVDEIS